MGDSRMPEATSAAEEKSPPSVPRSQQSHPDNTQISILDDGTERIPRSNPRPRFVVKQEKRSQQRHPHNTQILILDDGTERLQRSNSRPRFAPNKGLRKFASRT